MNTTKTLPALWVALAALSAAAFAQAPAPATPPAGAPAKAPAPGTLRFNFRGAPLETVLNYMSEAAGFVIVLETPVRGTVDMWSAQPVTSDEAVNLLNIALNKNGYTAVMQGRNIVVSSKDDAKKKNLPIRTGNDPEEIPSTAEMFIQIIPLRRLDAATAARDLGAMLPGSSTITANADSNSLLVTDTNINLKQVVALVNALDTSSDSVSTLRIFKLANADPYEMAALLTSLYATPTQGGGRGGPGGPFGGFPGGGFPGALGAALASAGGFGGGGGPGGGTGGRGGRGGTTTTNRSIPVVAVADPRTFSVIVTASKDAMPDIADMVAQLDAGSARKQKVFVYTMENANVKQVEATLKNLFPSSNTRTTTNQQPDALTTRATANAQNNAGTNLQLGSSGGRGN